MTELKIVKVAVENTALSFDGIFDYSVPPALFDMANEGCRVLVPFGRANVKKIGMIFSVVFTSDAKHLKSVTAVLDSSPVMSREMLDLALFMANNTFCPIYDAVRAQLPSGMNLRLTECYEKGEADEKTLLQLSDEQLRIYREIASHTRPVACKKLLERFGYLDDRVFSKLIDAGIIKITHRADAGINDKTQRSVRIKSNNDGIKLTEKQRSVLTTLNDIGEATVRDVLYFTGVTQSVLDSLCKKGMIEFFDTEVLRTDKIDFSHRDDVSSIALSPCQQKAYDGIKELLCGKPEAALLYGVTGSGKTQVFLKLIGNVIAQGKKAIVMVPEISLTPQTVKTFYRYFGSAVAVIHSGLSAGERYDQFKRIRTGEIDVVVGTRSAIFAPLSNIGIIVIDEEQESTYKSESSPRYHAREAAKFRCGKNGALLLLASATPSVDSFYNAKIGRYHLFSLSERFGTAVLPQVTIVDMSDRDIVERESAFSNTLLEMINENLKKKEQTILLYNRRGYHTAVTCGDCKQVMTCPNCSIALTYHKANGRLMCHYCGFSRELPESCDKCGSKRIYYKGQGTQRVEDELEMLFPEAKILRMDTDSSSGKSAHQKQFDAFERGEYDILVGTQMVAKGLNFPNVTLVGVLNADQTLYANDYRAYERAFSLVTQVVGRSGRGKLEGCAVIQSTTPENPIISLAAQQDYDSFYAQEIVTRRAMLYPPFCDLCVVGFISLSHTDAQKGAERFISLIKNNESARGELPLRVLGPSPMNVVKTGGKYRYRIIIKCKNNKAFRSYLLGLLREFQGDKTNHNISIFADMNEIVSF